MLSTILIILVILWFLGIIQIPGFAIRDMNVFFFNGRGISLLEILIFFVILWAIGTLRSPLRQIAGLLFILWVLSVLGFISIAGFSNILVIIIILGVVFALFGKH